MYTESNEIPVPNFSFLDSYDENEEEIKRTDRNSLDLISDDQLAEYMLDKNREFDLTIFDCRYSYEYRAGHIKGAVHVDLPNIIKSMFTDIDQELNTSFENHLLIFHCEFSVNRGPEMASTFRKIDRLLNHNRYPFLYYPHVFVLSGGFKKFYQKHSDLCEGYHLTMWSVGYQTSYEMKKRERLIKSLCSIEMDDNTQSFSLTQPINFNI